MVLNNADRHGIDQRITGIALFKINFPPYGRYAERVAVIADTANHTINQIANMGVFG